MPYGGVCLVRGGGVPGPGGAWSRGCGVPGPGGLVSGLEGVCAWSGGCLLRGGVGIPVCTESDTPLPPVDRQTPVKILPWPNFVAAGKNVTIVQDSPCILNGSVRGRVSSSR